MTKRKRQDKLPLQANVFPVPTLVYIEDDLTRFSVMSGQPLGGMNSESGVVDLFLDRQLLQDDQRGLGQSVVDNRRTRLTFKVLLEKKWKDEMRPSADVQLELTCLLHPVLLLSSTHLPPVPSPVSLIKQSLSCDLQVLNLRTCFLPRKYHLTLHRSGVSCDSCDADTVFNAQLFFSEAVSRHLFTSFNESRLSHQETVRQDIPLHETLQIPEMELLVFEFRRV